VPFDRLFCSLLSRLIQKSVLRFLTTSRVGLGVRGPTLRQLERGENVVLNLLPDEDVETEFVAFDRGAGWNESQRTAWRAAPGLPP
jgi:hypothetical protein